MKKQLLELEEELEIRFNIYTELINCSDVNADLNIALRDEIFDILMQVRKITFNF